MQESTTPAFQDSALRAAHAGAMLREAREAAGLSLEAVSQQLKLAPRQVKALEDGEFALLPGRTFVRGFARNYARLVHLDPDTVLGALSGTAATGGLDAPTLNATTGTMGELPKTARTRPSWIRWSIPIAILLAIAIGGIYEYMRSPARKNVASTAAPASRASAPAPAPAAPGTSVQPAPVAGASTPLANPIATTLSDDTTTPVPAGNTQDASSAALSIASRTGTWAEVRDSTGRTVFAQNIAAGQTQPIGGAPPFEITIGNAPDATVTFRGRVVDLAPYIRQNVARLTLQ